MSPSVRLQINAWCVWCRRWQWALHQCHVHHLHGYWLHCNVSVHHGLDPPLLHHQVVDHLLLSPTLLHGWTTVSSLARTGSRWRCTAGVPTRLSSKAHEGSKPRPGSFRLIWSVCIGRPTDMTLAAGALFGEAGRQTVTLKGQIAAWRCLRETSTLWSTLVRIMPYCSRRLEAFGTYTQTRP